MDIRAILMGLAFAFAWSSAFTSARIIVTDAPPLTALMLRFVFSGVIALCLARVRGESFQLTKDQWRATIIFGLCQNALYLGLNFVAMQTVEASVAAIVASTLPLLVALFIWLFYRERMPALGLIGLLAGFAGVILILGARLSGDIDLFGVGLTLIGVLALTIATLLLRGAVSGGNILTVVGLQMFVGAAILSIFAFPMETWEVNWSGRLIAAFAYTTIVPGVLATWIWFLLVDRIGATRAATFHFLNPVFGVAIAVVLLGETFGPLDVTGVVIVTAGILAVQLSKQAMR